jgi:aminodeoxyfutalosine synthase
LISTFDSLLDRVTAGDNLTADELIELAASHDILSLGMLADVIRRRLQGTRVTYLRVASWSLDRPPDVVSPAAREIRITGAPDTLATAVTAIQAAKAAAGERTVAGFSWLDIERMVANAGITPSQLLGDLRRAGLDALAEIPLDAVADIEAVIEQVTSAGFDHLRLTVEKAPAHQRTALWLRIAALRQRRDCIHTINPLPTVLQAFQPTTGYDDVRAVAIARLAAPNVPSIQVDWLRYGPKLAQVALTFGADDFDGVTASDEAPDGRRRAPLEEVRRGIEAAGLSPVERDGRFQVMS